jgi:hypothetical protein
MQTKNKGSRWFRRLVKEIKKLSPDFKIVHAKYGFYRIYWRNAYIHEVYDSMPYKGYDIEEEDLRNVSQSYYEEYEDSNEITRKIKNYVEGYWDSFDTIRTRLYMLKNDEEFRNNAQKAYQQFVVK